ncbi:2771_t:CDS:1, partial [Racocetra fulgida]
VIPDPVVAENNVTLSILGLLNKDIVDNGFAIVDFSDIKNTQLGEEGVTPVSPTKAGNAFSVNITFEAPDVLPDPCFIAVFVMDHKGVKGYIAACV